MTAYFRMRRGRTHAEGCLYHDQPASTGGAGRGRSAAMHRRPPVGVVDIGQAVGRPIPQVVVDGPPRDVDHRRRPTIVEVSTTRRSIAAAAFLHATGTDGGTPLDVRGIPTLRHSDYGHVFSRVGRTAPQVEEARIWFGELRTAQKVSSSDDRISVEFAVGCAANPHATPVERVKVEADVSLWSEFQRTVFRDRLIDAVSRAKGEFGAGRPVTRMYVLGCRNAESPCAIRIDHPRRFALVSGHHIRKLPARPTV